MMRAVLVLLLTYGAALHAQVSSETVLGQAKHMVTGGLSLTPGGISFSLEYENNFDRSFGLGIQTRKKSRNDSPASLGIVSEGVFIRPHFTRGPWDFSIAPGVSFMIIKGPQLEPDATGFGPTLSLSLMYQITNQFAVGAENFQEYDWTGSMYRGQVSNDTMVRVRYIF